MIYLDNASTTEPSCGVMEKVNIAMRDFGNPSSMHRLGISAEKYITDTKEELSRVLGVDTKNLYFTSCGTESNNTAILGYCRRNRKKGNHIITTKIEHPSVTECFKRLEQEGFEVTYIGVNENGIIDLDEFTKSLLPDTILVSCMWVNNETGSIQPIEKLKPIMKDISPKAVLHVDAVQAFGKIVCKPKKMGIDMLSISGHKIHAIKGIGALYVNDGVLTEPYLIGGGQQNNRRSGTENTVGIAALGQAISELDIENGYEKTKKLREMLLKGILDSIDNVTVNGTGDVCPYVLNVSFIGIKAEILLHSLEAREVFVSTGSACSVNKPMPSHVLTAMGRNQKEISGAVRFSFSKNVTEEDIKETLEILKDEVFKIRKIMR